MTKALIFGASGLVGSFLVEELVKNPNYDEVHLFLRNSIEIEEQKIVQHLIDFDRLKDFSKLISGNDLFICLGTTIGKAGSVQRVEEIDRDYPISIARIAKENGVKRIAVVSSIGANAKSRNYYLRIKGEMEAGIQALNFEKTIIAQPSMLLGSRQEFRFGEFIGKGIASVLGIFMFGKLAKYRAIHGRTVAQAMVRLVNSDGNKVIFSSDELME